MKISSDLKGNLAKIARKYHLRMILPFGSAVTFKLHFLSDLDLAVLYKEADFSWDKYTSLLDGLQKIFPKKKIDLAIINRTDPLFLKKITESCQLLYGSSQELAELKIYAFKRYTDHKKYLEMEEEFVDHFINRHLKRGILDR